MKITEKNSWHQKNFIRLFVINMNSEINNNVIC